MRFTTWSPLTNAFIISTVALLSLIQVANAFAELFIITPNGRELSPIPGDSITIRWFVYNDTELPATDTARVKLMNDDTGYNYEFEQVTVYNKNDVCIGYLKDNVTLPDEIFPSGAYYIQFITSFGVFNGSHFMIK